jgi:transforming growth factor-beta-induced protein
MKNVLKFVLILLGLGLSPVAGTQTSILDLAKEKGFTILVTALKIAKLDGTLDCCRFCHSLTTAFAPTDAAFSLLPTSLVNRLTTDVTYVEHLRQLLLYHLVPGRVFSNNIANGAIIATKQGETIRASKSSKGITINGNAKVVVADLRASNGVVHAIDKVLVPNFLSSNLVDIAVSAPDFSRLVAAVGAVNGLSDVLAKGNFTIFAPTNDAFARLNSATTNSLRNATILGNVLKYHVVPGIVPAQALRNGGVRTVQGRSINVVLGNSRRRTRLNGVSRVIATNILASNGVIHVIVSALQKGNDAVRFAII